MRKVLVVAQSGGPSAVVNASLAGAVAEARRLGAFGAVYGLVHGVEGALGETLVDLTQVSDATLQELAHTPGAALGSTRRAIVEADFARWRAVFRAHEVGFFAYIGGNGSMWVCQRLAALDPDLRVMGIPKTVDNDLTQTDHTPGYGSAARFLALAVRDTGRDVEAMRSFEDVVLVEALGRNTGWLAAAAALLKDAPDDAPHLVYVPEVPFDEAAFLDDVRRIHARLGIVFVVVAEGVRDAAGVQIGQRGAPTDALGRVVPSLAQGAATILGDLVRERLGLRARVLRPGLIGRALTACVSPTDRREAWAVGAAAVARLAAGEHGQMVTLERTSDAPYAVRLGGVPLLDVAGVEKPLPRAYMDERGTMISEAFRQYARPLIEADTLALGRLDAPLVSRRLMDHDP
jgi:6-phosphofructokinase 1